METWKRIPIAPDYEASDLGRLRRIRPSIRERDYKPIDGTVMPKGYRYVCLRVNGAPKTFQWHRLIMAAFHGTSDLQVNHINGNKLDNRLANLEYVDGERNRLHAKSVLDAYPKGSRHPNSVLNEKDVRMIKVAIRAGIPDSEIAEIFGCTAANIYVIRKGRGWTHVK